MSYAYEKINNYVKLESSFGGGATFAAGDILFAQVGIKENIHFVDVDGLNKKRMAIDRCTEAKKDVSVSISDFDMLFNSTSGYDSVKALLKSFFGAETAYASIGTAGAGSTSTLIDIDSSGALAVGDLVAIEVGGKYEIRWITSGDDTSGWTVNKAFTLTVAGADVHKVQQYFLNDTDTNISVAILQDIYGEKQQTVTGVVVTEFKGTFDQGNTVKIGFSGEGKDLTIANSSSLGYSLGSCGVVGLSGASTIGSYDLTVAKVDFNMKNGMSLLKESLHSESPTKIITAGQKEITGSLTVYSDNIEDIRTLARGGTTTTLFSVVDNQAHAEALYLPKIVIEPFDVPTGDVGEMVFTVNFKALYDYTNGYFPVFGYI